MGKKRGKSPILHTRYRTSSYSASSSFWSQRLFLSKGQISTFLIIALVLVLFVSVIFFVVNSQFSLREKASQSVISELSLFPPEKFVTHCVQKEVVDITQTALAQGGVYDLVAAQRNSENNRTAQRSFESTNFRAQPYLFWSRASTSLGNQFISADFVAEQINQQLPLALLDCINLTLYGDQGYTVRSGKLLTNTSISPDSINVVVYYPLSIEKGDTQFDRSLYSVAVDLPIGNLLSMSRQIVNSHLQTPNYPLDTQSLMHQKENEWLSKPLIVIDKNTVYPHTLYDLHMTYKETAIDLRFAIEGQDVFSSFSSSGMTAIETASCIAQDGACFDAVSYNLCVAQSGEFVQDQFCAQHRWPIAEATTYTFAPCVFADGSTIQSGSSWCAAGSDGQPMIGVGSRHSRLLCVDGAILQEPCQDYRLEVCAQTQQDGLLVAQCQPNLGLQCSACTDKSCCESVAGESCTFTAQQACVPKTPLGIPFWKSEVGAGLGSSAAIATSASGNTKANICQEQFSIAMDATNGRISSPLAQATLCAQHADCGATISVIGETTLSNSQFDSDYYTRLTSFWQQQKIPYISTAYASNSDDVAGVSALQQRVALAQSQVTAREQQQSLSAVLSNALADIEQLGAYNTSEYLDPNVSIGLTTQQLSCQPYLAPRSPSCEYCTLFDEACSEYVCRSLGSSCRAIQNVSSISGVTCIDSANMDSTPIRITKVTDGRGVPLGETALAGVSGYVGYLVSQPLAAHELLTINLTTNRPARCKPTYLPSLSFTDVGSLDLSSGEFTTQHQLRIKFVNDLPVFDRVLANFAVPDYTQLVSALADFKLRLDQLRLRYGFIQKYNPTFYPYLNTIVEQYLSDRTRPALLSLIEGISRKQFAIFFVCQDAYGAELEQSPFVQFKLASSCAPVPPTVLSTVSDASPYVQKEVTVYLNKLGSCRYDAESVTYDVMKYNMTCATSEYDLSSALDGAYACVADTSVFARDVTQMYIACSDKPTNTLMQREIGLVHNASVPARVLANISNQTLTSQTPLMVSSRATLWTGYGYRCAVQAKAADGQVLSTSLTFGLSCASDSCTITYKNTTQASQTDVVTQSVNNSLICTPRVPVSSCAFDQTHISAPQAVPLVRLPSFVYEEASVYGREFVVSVTSRGTPITCTLTDESGKVFTLFEKESVGSKKTFAMPVSALADKSLVTITCADGYGLAPQFVSMVKK